MTSNIFSVLQLPYNQFLDKSLKNNHQNHLNHIKPLKKEATNEWEVKPSRVGGPGRKLYLRCSKHNVHVAETSQESVVRAVTAYENEKLARGTKVALNSRLKWWLERCKVRRWAPYPLTVAKLQYMGALLKASKYRSATQNFRVVL